MRLNGKKIIKAMESNGLTEDMLCMRTGFYRKSLQWILKEGFASEESAERIADAVGVSVGEILLPEISGDVENSIEFIKGDGRATVTFSQGRFKGRVRKLAVERPEECQIVAEDKDGSLCAHIPVSWIRIVPPMELSEERKETLRERMLAYHSKHGKVWDKNGQIGTKTL